MKTTEINFEQLADIFETKKEIERKEHTGMIESTFEWHEDDTKVKTVFHGYGSSALMVS